MAVGAFDQLDRALVKKYNMLKADNPIIESSMIDPNKMYDAMNDFAQINKAMLDIQRNLRSTCIQAMAPNIQYTKTKQLRSMTSEG